MNAFGSLRRSARAAVARMAPRERALSAVLLLIGCGYLALSAWDWSNAEEDRARASSVEHQQAIELAKRARDASEQPAGAKQAERLRGLSFSASTTSIARADAQAALRTAGTAAGIEDLAVTLEPPSPGSTRLALQAMVVEGKFNWRSFLAFCDYLAQSKQAFLVDALSVTAGRSPRFRLSVTTSLASQSP